jgi:hypothetical protein
VRADECYWCKRRQVALLVLVAGRLYDYGGRLHRRDLPLGFRTRATCLDGRACRAYRERKRERAALRSRVPEDFTGPQLHEPEGGRCKWCGEAIYRKRKADGAIVPARARMWHDGRTVDPRAEPEPECVQTYNRAQAWTFRQAVFVRDAGVCASCGLDVPAEQQRLREELQAYRGRFTDHDERYEAARRWVGSWRRSCRAWWSGCVRCGRSCRRAQRRCTPGR